MLSAGRSPLLWASLAAQGLGLGLYGYQFLVSVFGIRARTSWVFHEIAEVAAFFALILGTCLTLMLLFKAQKTQEKLQSKVDAASQQFQEVVLRQFAHWGFTDAESEIGVLLIKGLSIAEIADLRGRSQATIKAQNTAIYQKSGLTNRAQLVSYFVEDLASGL